MLGSIADMAMLTVQLIRSGISYGISLFVAAAQKLPSWAGSRALWPLLAVRGFVGEAHFFVLLPMTPIGQQWYSACKLLSG